LNENYNLLIDADIDEVFAVNNKEITPPQNYNDIVVEGDNKSNSLIFKIDSVLDGIDIFDMVFEIFYINADNYSDIVPANAVSISENYILFSWLLDSNVTHTAGKVNFIIRISGADYVWKSKPYSFDVVETLEDTVNSAEYSSTWSAGIEKRLSELEGGKSVASSLFELNSRIAVLEDTVKNDNARISALEQNIVIDYSKIYVGVSNKVPNFSTIAQALECVGQHKDEYDGFDIFINAGTYNEQLYVDLPNVHLHSYTGNKNVTVTWYYGIGYTYYSADPSTGRYNKTSAVNKFLLSPVSDWGGTVIVTDNAENFTAKNIIFENSFNKRVSEYEIADGVTADPNAYSDTSITLDRTAEDFIPTSRAATERAAAMVIRADKVEFMNCEFIGSQDTLYFGSVSSSESNRGYFSNCNIYGMTDFIFGFGNVIFQKCNMLFCGYSDNYTEKAFITANRAADKGFLFNHCTVDYDTTLNSDIPENRYYLGRTWGVGARTAFNKTHFNNIGILNEDFWTEMSGTLDEAFYTEAKSYDKDVLISSFDISNEVRASKYMDSLSFTREEWFGNWKPVSFEEEYENVCYDFQCNNEGAYNDTIQGTSSVWNGLTINAESGKLAPNAGANCTQMNAGTTITIPVQTDCIVTVEAYTGQGNGKLILNQNETAVTADNDVLSINAVKGEVILEALENTYINSIAVIYEQEGFYERDN